MLLAPLLLTTGTSIGATLRVPQDYSTIQAAIESASPGDEVVISPGTYEGGVFVDKDLTLRGEGEVILAGGFVPSEDQIDLKALYGLLALNPRLSFTVRVCILVNGAHVILENLAIERADIGLLATEEAESLAVSWPRPPRTGMWSARGTPASLLRGVSSVRRLGPAFS